MKIKFFFLIFILFFFFMYFQTTLKIVYIIFLMILYIIFIKPFLSQMYAKFFLPPDSSARNKGKEHNIKMHI